MRVLRRAVALMLVLLPGGVTGQAPSESKPDAKPPYQRLLQGDDAKQAAALAKQVAEKAAADQYAEAITAAERLLALRARVQGADHPEAVSERWKVERLRRLGALPADEWPAWWQGLTRYRQAHQLYSQGRYREALPLFREYDDTTVRLLGKTHPDTATSHYWVATCLQAQGQYAEALPLHRQALEISRQTLGETHPSTAISYNNVAFCLQAQGQSAEALPLFRQALQVYRQALGEAHPHTATSYNNVAACLEAQGQAAEALPLFRKALEITRQALGKAHPDTATSYNNVAHCLEAQGQYAEALPLYRQALEITRQALGEAHPDTATSYNNVALCLQSQGQLAEALPLYRKALQIRRQALGEAHPSTARGYNNLAGGLQAQGQLAEALPLFRQALEIRRQSLGEAHPDTATSYNNVALCLQDQGQLAEALPLFRQALEIRRQALGEAHSDTARGYNNLARCLQDQGQSAEALPLFRQALETFRQSLGETHPHTATGYHNLAACLQARGRSAEALPLFRQALEILRQALGEAHPDTATNYNNLAVCLHAQGQLAEAVRHWERALFGLEFGRLSAAERGLDRALFKANHLSPRQALAAALVGLGRPDEGWRHAESDLGRGLLDELAAPAELSPNEQQQLARLTALQAQLLPLLSLEKPGEAQRQQVRDLSAERDRLQQTLAEAAVRRSRERVLPLEQVQRQLPNDAALVFWLDLPTLKQHLGCVLRRDGEPHWVTLPGSGPAGAWTEDDDTLSQRLRAALAGTGSDPAAVQALGQQLRRQRLAPLQPHLQGVNRLFVVPVGRMAALPVVALADEWTVSYVPSGTHLARLLEQPRRTAAARLLALGDPVFAQPEVIAKDAALPEHGLLLTQVQPGSNAQRSGLRPGDVLLRYAGQKLTTLDDLRAKADAGDVPVEAWRAGKILKLTMRPGPLGVLLDKRPAREAIAAKQEGDRLLATATRGPVLEPLPGTRREVETLARLFAASDVLLGRDASEQRLDTLRDAKQLETYSHLHFATHGLANNDKAFESALALAQDALPDNAEQIAKGLKPIDGRLTAREVLGWKLDAELVVLSACESGLGQSGGGDGLLGFAQAFLLAGARSVVLSLWPVDDTATALLMQRFYQNLLGQRDGVKTALTKTVALAEAQAWLRELTREQIEAEVKLLPRGAVRVKSAVAATTVKPFAHPHYWAAFILIGDPR